MPLLQHHPLPLPQLQPPCLLADQGLHLGSPVWFSARTISRGSSQPAGETLFRWFSGVTPFPGQRGPKGEPRGPLWRAPAIWAWPHPLRTQSWLLPQRRTGMAQRSWPQGRVQGAWRRLEPGHSRVTLRPRGLPLQAPPQAREGTEPRRNIRTHCCGEPQSPWPLRRPRSRPSLALHPLRLQGGTPSQSRGPGNTACVKCPRAPSRRPAGRHRGQGPALQATGRASGRSRRTPGNS